jgi:hypothetical protein
MHDPACKLRQRIALPDDVARAQPLTMNIRAIQELQS